MLEKVFKSHTKWINTTKKFGCSKEEAEDIVGDMYCIIGKMLNNGLDISYGNEVNYFYIYRTLKTSFLQMKNKQNKENNVSLDLLLDIEAEEPVYFTEANDKVLKVLDSLYWYDSKIYNIIEDGSSITELAKKTGISYHSIYNTYRKVKAKLRQAL